MRTLRTKAPSISSDNVLQLHCPKAWNELTQDQLRYALSMIGSDLYDSASLRTYLLLQFTGITIHRRLRGGTYACSVVLDNRKRHYFDLQDWQVQDMIGQLKFVERPEEMDIRLEDIHGLRPVDKLLHGLPFIDYLNLEAAYQGWVATKRPDRIEKMAMILYRDENGDLPDEISLDVAERTNVLFWYFHVKAVLASSFRHFFKPLRGESTGKYDHMAAFNAQLRALTDGDITKEEQVKMTNCWRALTELDAKAREAEDFKKKYNGNK